MGLRGPKPTPKPLLEARGTARADRHGDIDARPPVEAPSCPTWLSTEAKAEWKRVTKYLLAMGCVAECDRSMLAVYCEAWSEFVQLVRDVKVYAKENSMAAAVATGLVGARNKAADSVAKLAAHFGFSPAARARVKVFPEGGEGDASDGGKPPTLYKIRG